MGITALPEDQVQKHLAFLARILPQGIRKGSNGDVFVDDNALIMLKQLAKQPCKGPKSL